MSVLQNATKHFNELVQNNLKEYHVEEWDATIYYRPTLTWREQSRILDLTTNGKTSEALIETLIIRCLDKDGKPLFNGPDRVTLSNEVDPAVILKIVGIINNTVVTNEEIEKNLE
tara:strand:+ start:209 stop:553 length:345 start_codon:yes stop_codon:yes gene_type:complete